MIQQTHLRKLISVFAVVITMTVIAQNTFAAMQAYLKVDGVKGSGTKIHTIIRCSDGSCSLGRLPVGTYKVTVCWVDGGKTAMDDWSAIIKAAAATTGAPTSTSITITSKPRDQATGQATGKRMHQPLSIMKTTDKSSPVLFDIVAADVDGDGMLDVMITCRKAGEHPMK